MAFSFCSYSNNFTRTIQCFFHFYILFFLASLYCFRIKCMSHDRRLQCNNVCLEGNSKEVTIESWFLNSIYMHVLVLGFCIDAAIMKNVSKLRCHLMFVKSKLVILIVIGGLVFRYNRELVLAFNSNLEF